MSFIIQSAIIFITHFLFFFINMAISKQKLNFIRLACPWDSPGKNTGVGCHFLLQCMKVKSESEVAQSCPTLRDPMDCSLSGSWVHGIFQARVLEWGAIAFSNLKASKQHFKGSQAQTPGCALAAQLDGGSDALGGKG